MYGTIQCNVAFYGKYNRRYAKAYTISFIKIKVFFRRYELGEVSVGLNEWTEVLQKSI